MAVEVPAGAEGQPLPHPVAPGVQRRNIAQVGEEHCTPGVERKNIPQAQGEFPAGAILLGFLQTEQELL